MIAKPWNRLCLSWNIHNVNFLRLDNISYVVLLALLILPFTRQMAQVTKGMSDTVVQALLSMNGYFEQ